MAEFFDVCNQVFWQKEWDFSEKDKEKACYMLNLNMSKKYPYNAELLNNKNIPSHYIADIWHLYFRDHRKIPKWFWKKKL